MRTPLSERRQIDKAETAHLEAERRSLAAGDKPHAAWRPGQIETAKRISS
jgi:hypothetical protein